MGSEYKVEKLTAATLIWVTVLSVVLTVFWDLFALFLPPIASCTQNVSSVIPTPGVELMGGPFLMLIIIMGLIRIPYMRGYLTTANLVYLYVTSLAVAYFANFNHPWGVDGGFVFIKLMGPEQQVKYIPDFVAPSGRLVETLHYGVGSIVEMPWIDLTPNIIWHFLLVALFGGMGIGLASLFRRRWIDVEMVPYPHVLLAHTTMVNIESSVKGKWSSKTPFLMGILVGILLGIPLSGATLFPWFPDLYMWRSNTCGPGSHWIAPPDIPWHLGLTKHPPLYAFLLLAPLHALISILFYLLVLEMALFASFYAFGAYTGMLQMGFCGRNWCTPTPYTDPPLNLFAINTGSVLGLFIVTIVLEGRYILETLKVAFGKTSSDQEEPVSYRFSWILLIASFTSMVIFFAITGLSPWISFVLPLTGIITWFTMSQLWGRIGFETEPCYNFTPGFFKLLAWPTLHYPEVMSTDIALTPFLVYEYAGHMSMTGWGGSFYTILASYKMAKLTGVSPRNILKVTVVALLVSMLSTKIVQISAYSVFGGQRFSWPPIWRATNESFQGFHWSRPVDAPISEVSTYIAVGFIFMILMKYLYTRFLWLPDPLFSIVAWDWVISLHGTWVPVLVAFMIKSIVLKIGGSKLYEDCVVPFVGGFIFGSVLEVFATAISSYLLFPPTI
ncbi:hypothetical protein KEJ27_07855 [Candidatus Bathyarchaeota archaeon]|nr:hypothetical protein [Candidatus Bathyarchaeota archaeon]